MVIQIGRSGVIALSLVACLASNLGAAQLLPSEFVGVWMVGDSGRNECTKADWNDRKSDRLMNVSPRSIEYWESGCDIVGVATQNQQSPEAVTSKCPSENILNPLNRL